MGKAAIFQAFDSALFCQESLPIEEAEFENIPIIIWDIEIDLVARLSATH